MKLIFAGTPDFAVQPLKALYRAGNIAAVVTQPDKIQGRKGRLTCPPVKQIALDLKIPVLQPERIRDEIPALEAVGADLMITCAYGQILTEEILNLFPLGVWNLHASLLPEYRGAAPIARAIIDGRTKTGITVMKTELGLDTGNILLSHECEILDTDTCQTLSERLSNLASEMISPSLDLILRGAKTRKQGDGFVCKKVQRTETDFFKNAREVSCLIRGLSPSPLAFGRIGDLTLNFFFAEEVSCTEGEAPGTVISASPKEGLIVKCGEGAVKITELQASGGKRMSAKDFLNGRRLEKGQRFEKERIL